MTDTSELDFSGKEQLYSQLYDILFQGITSGAYKIGDYIPSESDLMKRYDVSRATARKAMELLSNNGLIEKKRGRGSEVIANVPLSSPKRVSSYIKKNVDEFAVPQKRLIESGVVTMPQHVARELGLAEGTKAFCLRRVRVSGDRPFYLETIYYEDGYVPHIAERDFSKESLRAYLNNSCDIRWSRVSQKIGACVATDEQAELLGISAGAPLLNITRVSHDQQNVPREYVESFYRADLYRLEIELD